MPYKDPEQRRKYSREWVKKRRSEWFANKFCVQCGSIDNLQLDHVNRDTKITHKVWSWKEERRNGELAKCQVLCHSCHKRKSGQEHSQWGPRGELNSGSKLTGEQVDAIRLSTESAQMLASQYGVTRTTIYDIRNQKRWTYRPNPQAVVDE